MQALRRRAERVVWWPGAWPWRPESGAEPGRACPTCDSLCPTWMRVGGMEESVKGGGLPMDESVLQTQRSVLPSAFKNATSGAFAPLKAACDHGNRSRPLRWSIRWPRQRGVQGDGSGGSQASRWRVGAGRESWTSTTRGKGVAPARARVGGGSLSPPGGPEKPRRRHPNVPSTGRRCNSGCGGATSGERKIREESVYAGGAHVDEKAGPDHGRAPPFQRGGGAVCGDSDGRQRYARA